MFKQPPSAPTASAVGPCPTVFKIVGRPGTRSLPSTFAPPDHPLKIIKIIQLVTFSKKFNKHQKNYSTIQKECLCLILALQHFEVYLTFSSSAIIVSVITIH